MSEQWPVKPITDICEIFSDGDWIESKDQSPSGIRLVQTGNIGEGVFKDRKDKARYISESTFSRLNCTEIFEGDCLISRLPRPVGRACIIHNTGERMITAVDCSILRFKQDMILPQFFVYYTQSAHYNKQIQPLCTGSTRKRISRKNLGKITIPIPPLEVQQRIVSNLDEAFKNIRLKQLSVEQNLIQSGTLIQSIFDSMFENPNWTSSTFDEIATIKGGKRLPKGHTYSPNTTVHPYISVKDFTSDGTIDTANLKYIDEETFDQISQYTISSNDLYLSIAGTIGKTGIVPAELDGANLTENACKFIFNEGFNAKFVYYFTKTTSFHNQAGLLTKATGQPKLALTRLKQIVICSPDSQEQEKLVKRLDEITQQSRLVEEKLRQKLQNLDDLRLSILQLALIGKLTGEIVA